MDEETVQGIDALLDAVDFDHVVTSAHGTGLETGFEMTSGGEPTGGPRGDRAGWRTRGV